MYFTLVFLLSGLINFASGQDSCNISPQNQTTCRGATDIALGDDRLENKPSQCRVACQRFSHPNIAVSIISANCSFELCDPAPPFSTFDVDTRMCQPRTVCIRASGEEPAGCVYSGTCREFTCFQDKDTGRPANFSRLTYAGPRSIVQVNDSKTSDDGTSENLLDAVLNSRDKCSDNDRPRTIDRHCGRTSFSKGTFLSDSLNPNSIESFRQCRVACGAAKLEDVEVVRMRTFCGSCQGDGRSEGFICSSQSECERACGSSYSSTDGCVFTGSCRSLICVSGIDSRQPAIISVSNTTGFNGKIISVNNDVEPTIEDPPVFMKFLETVEVPNVTVLKEIEDRIPSKNGPDGNTSASSSDGSKFENDWEDGNEEEASRKESASKWTWLGPIVGLVGAILTAVAALGAAYVTGRYASNIVINSKGRLSDQYDIS